MAHERLRPYRTACGVTMCMAVRAGDHLVMRADGSGDAAAQAEEAMRGVRSLLEEAGGGLEHVRSVTVYLTDRAWQEAVAAVIGRHLGDAVARVGVIVAGLREPERLVEIEAEAVL